MLDCKSESKHGRIARQSGATTRLTNCRTSNRFEKMLLASFHKCCKIRCVVWTRPTKRSSVESSVGKKLDSLGSKDATVTTVSRIRKRSEERRVGKECRPGNARE